MNRNKLEPEASHGALVGADTLIDGVALALAGMMAKALSLRLVVNRLEYFYLLLLYGGVQWDDEGVAGIDTDIKFLEETIVESERVPSVRNALRTGVTLVSESAPLALLKAFEERGIVSIPPFRHNAYNDGLSYLTTGDPDVASSDPTHNLTMIYSFVGDVTRRPGWQDDWKAALAHLPSTFAGKLLNSEIVSGQFWTRIMNLGVAARQGYPIMTNRAWIKEWLDNLCDTTGKPLLSATAQSTIPLLSEAISGRPDRVTVGDVCRFLDGGLTDLLVEVYEGKQQEAQILVNRHRRQDLLILLVNLTASPIPGISQIATLLSYLYQRVRGTSGDRP